MNTNPISGKLLPTARGNDFVINPNKQIIMFDLDDTITKSKTQIDPEMANLLAKLLKRWKVVIVSGASHLQFQEQVINCLDFPIRLIENLYLFPLNATALYVFLDGKEIEIYREDISEPEKGKIEQAFSTATKDIDIPWGNSYGEIIEDRGSQMTFSALGQQAPLELKTKWDPAHKKREKIRQRLLPLLPNFNISIGGKTSIDVTRKGRDKSYCLGKIKEHLKIEKDNILFIGDALFVGGNDYPIKEAGVDCISVKGVEECKNTIRKLLRQ